MFVRAQTCARSLAHPPAAFTTTVLTRNVDRRSLVDRFRRRIASPPAERPARTPPSTFLFLPIHLSNSPEPRRSHPSGEPESRRSLKPPTGSEAFLPLIVRSFEGAQSRRNADGAPYLRYIGVRPDKCQHIMPEILASVAQEPVQNRLLLYRFAASSNRVGGKPNAALRPHFSAVLDQSVGGCSDRG